MRFHEDAVEPRIERATDGKNFIVKAEIPDNLSARRIGWADFGAPAEKAIGLIKISSLRDVCGNHPIVLAGFRNAVHLNGEKHGDSIFLEFAGEGHSL